MEIRFCDRCDARLKMKDVQSGRCRQAGERIWCPACTRDIERVLADPIRAQVVAEPPAQKAPSGVQAVSGKDAAKRRRRSRGRK